MRLPWLSVKRPPSSSEARKLRCFFKSRAVMLFSSSRDGSGKVAATTATAINAAIMVAVSARFNASFDFMKIPWAGTGSCRLMARSSLGDRADYHCRQMLRVEVGARYAPDIFDGDGANQLRVAFEIIEPQIVGLCVYQEVGDLQALLKV